MPKRGVNVSKIKCLFRKLCRYEQRYARCTPDPTHSLAQRLRGGGLLGCRPRRRGGWRHLAPHQRQHAIAWLRAARHLHAHKHTRTGQQHIKHRCAHTRTRKHTHAHTHTNTHEHARARAYIFHSYLYLTCILPGNYLVLTWTLPGSYLTFACVLLGLQCTACPSPRNLPSHSSCPSRTRACCCEGTWLVHS